MLMIWWCHLVTNCGGRTLINPAKHTKSTPCSSRIVEMDTVFKGFLSTVNAGIPKLLAIASPGASGLFDTTQTTLAGNSWLLQTLANASKFDPRPEIKTPIRNAVPSPQKLSRLSGYDGYQEPSWCCRTNSFNNITPKPVAPLGEILDPESFQAIPAISMWAQGTLSMKRCKNCAAVILSAP